VQNKGLKEQELSCRLPSVPDFKESQVQIDFSPCHLVEIHSNHLELGAVLAILFYPAYVIVSR
jgi:hypothetical protein